MADQVEGGVEKLIEVSGGGLSVPFTVITTDDGMEIKISGYDIKHFKKALKI